MKTKDILNCLDNEAPFSLQEDYDNAGLLLGSSEKEISSALICLDITLEIIEEAKSLGSNLIISHHPIMMGGIKRINGKSETEKIIIEAIKNDISILSVHTNIDSIENGVSKKISEKLGLNDCKVLSPRKNELKKLVTFVPKDDAEKVRLAMLNSGAGHIGEYDCCSFNIEGKGTFRASEKTNPYVGEKGKIHIEPEMRIETVFPKFLQHKIIHAMIEAHPYEEVPHDIYPLNNIYSKAGFGLIGELDEAMEEKAFLRKLKDAFGCDVVRHTALLGKQVKKVAVCGGSGSFLLNSAIGKTADVFVSGDFKYHQFFDANRQIIIADIGHFESEQYTIELIFDILKKNLPKFAVHLTKINTNPIKYFV